METVGYDAMFTFIYSPRVGTRAAAMPDPMSREDKQRNFDRLLELSNRISAEKHAAYVGTVQEVLIDGPSRTEGMLSSRTMNGRLVHLPGGEELIGRFAKVKITGSNTWALTGEML